jgi:hypothetical protein
MHLRAVFSLLAGLAVFHFAASAAAVPFGFECITYNNAADCAIGEAQVVMDVGAGPGADQVSFTFQNVGSDTSTIARIYFDDGSLSVFHSVINGPGVSFTFESRTLSDGDRNFRDLDLEPSYFDALVDYFIVRHIGNHVLISANTCRKDLWYIGIGYSWEAVVDRPGCCGVPFICDLSQSHNKCEHTVLII